MKRRTVICLELILSLVWISAVPAPSQNLLFQPESVVYDPNTGHYIVSNASNGKIIEYTNATTQSLWNHDQTSVRGLHIVGDKLYAACNAGVAEFDLATGTRTNLITIAEQNFLNDITSDADGNLYVSDTDGGNIYKVDPATATSSTLASGLTFPNGLLYDGANSRLLLAEWDNNASIYNVRLPDGAVGLAVSTSFTNLDGLAEDNAGRIYVSAHGDGKIYRYDHNFNEAPEEVSSGHNGPADIFYHSLIGNLIIPNFNSNTIDIVMMETIIVVPPGSTEVINTNDTGTGSLRAAIENANTNSGADTITFNIPVTDPNYDAGTGVFTIFPQSEIPALTDGSTFIDGISQSENQGDTNILGVEIEIDCSKTTGNGITINSAGNMVQGLIINNCSQSGFLLTGSGATQNIIQRNFIGTDESGLVVKPNSTGIYITEGASDNLIGERGKGNLISGNSSSGIRITGDGTNSNRIQSCFIGVDATMDNSLGNGLMGIEISFGARYNNVGGIEVGNANIVSGTVTTNNAYTGHGIVIREANQNGVYGNLLGSGGLNDVTRGNSNCGVCIINCDSNTVGGFGEYSGNVIIGNGLYGILIRGSEYNLVIGNNIGVDFTGTEYSGNDQGGVMLDYGSKNNLIGPDNIIAYNGGNGVEVVHDSTTGNTITQNSIKRNNGKGIDNVHGGNGELAPPVLTSWASQQVEGIAPAGLTIELFSDSLNEGGVYTHTVTSKVPGGFASQVTYEGPCITATATDAAGNTSEFSNNIQTAVDEDDGHIPRILSLDQNFPNPFNPETQIRYTLPIRGQVRLTIHNNLGQQILTLVNRYQEAGRYAVMWIGKDKDGIRVSSGIYIYKLQLGDAVVMKKLVLAK